jgi:agmatine deiminase
MTSGSHSEGAPAAMMPAEWDSHRATWLAWPHDRELWGEELEPVVAEFVALCRVIADGGERIELMVHESIDDGPARALLDGLDVGFHAGRYGDIWLRDTAPVFVYRGVRIEGVAFRFNGWGGKYLLDGDAEVAATIAHEAGFALRQLDWVGEGGALDFNGRGVCLASAACLLSRERNAALMRRELERSLLDAFGVVRVIWLDEVLLGDHTDGHVDTLARFVSADTVVCAEPASSNDPNAGVLDKTRRALAAAGGLNVVAVPSPGTVADANGNPLPASYLNFYIANGVVAVPTYGCANDDEAVACIARCFPDRRVVGLSARAILEGGGAFHCITQQEPRA